MVGRLGIPLGDLVWLPRGFPLIRPQDRPLQENLQDPLKTYKIQPKEKEWILKVMESLWKVVGGWNEARECLGPLQNSKPKLGDGWICSKILEKFPCEMMKLVRD